MSPLSIYSLILSLVLLTSLILVTTASTTPGETLPWGVQQVKANLVWDKDGDMTIDPDANAGDGIVIAVIDEGIDNEHEDLADNFKGGDTGYHSPHGTHVAGTIAAVDNNVGVIGVAPRVWLYSFKIAFGAPDFYDQVARAIRKAAFEYGAEVISMSFGFYRDYSVIRDACDYAYYDLGALLIAASGDENKDFVIYPAKYDSVIAVGATNQSNERWDETLWDGSNYGPELELVAPGVDIYSTYPDNNYKTLTGTSMAVPHVSGVAALIFASEIPYLYDEDCDGRWDNFEVRKKLQDTAIDLGPAGRDEEYGHGLVDAYEAAKRTDPAITNVTVDSTVVLEGDNVTAYVTVENLGSFPETFDLEVSACDSTQQYCFEDTVSVYLDAEASETLAFTWNTTGYPTTTYTIEAFIDWYELASETNITNNDYTDGTFEIIPSINLVVRVPQALPEGVNVYVAPPHKNYTSPVNITIKSGYHIIEVPESFLKESGGVYYVYTFDHWNDDIKDNPRIDNLTADTTFTAIYRKQKYGILSG